MGEKIKISAKTLDEALTQASLQLETTSDMLEYDIIDRGSSGFLGFIGAKPVVIEVKKKGGSGDVEKVVREFTENLFSAMGEEVQTEITTDETDNSMNIVFSGPDMGVLIGKRGQTLDSIQYLISLVANKNSDTYVRVRVDTENYRERRKATLENLAKNIAFKVKRTRHSVVLEPMNPYERRIIHSALQGDKYVETHSEGDEPYRRIVVTLKKEYRDKAPRGGDRKPYKNKGGYNRRSSNPSERPSEDVVENREDSVMEDVTEIKENSYAEVTDEAAEIKENSYAEEAAAAAEDVSEE